jgi:hypothetical protein
LKVFPAILVGKERPREMMVKLIKRGLTPAIRSTQMAKVTASSNTLSRRFLVTSAAALPALAVPGIAVAACAEPDPIYAAIEKYQHADEVCMARFIYKDNLEDGNAELTLARNDLALRQWPLP